MMKKNKRGFLLGEETVKIIIAVVCIIVLIAFAVALYEHYAGSKELEYAQSSLSHLTTEISAGSTNDTIYNPSGKDWYISSFPQVDSGGSDIMPQSCSSVGWSHCICIYSLSGGKNVAVDADNSKSGVCAKSDFTIVGSVQITAASSFGASYEFQGISLKKVPLGLAIDHQQKIIQEASS